MSVRGARRFGVVAITTGFALNLAPRASADPGTKGASAADSSPPPSEVAPVKATNPTRADALFIAGKQLRDAGLYDDACPKFAESEELDPGVGVSLYLADCYQHQGRTANAWAEFRKAEQLARDRNDKRADVAKARANALEAKLTRITIAVTDAGKHPGLTVTVDGTRIRTENYNVMLPVDPGTHAIEVTEPGQAARSLNVRLDDGANVTVPIFASASAPPAQASVAAAPAPSVPPASAPAAQAPAEATSDSSSTAASKADVRTYIGFGLLGGGTVALAVGAGLLDLENRSLSKGHYSSNAGTFSGIAFGLGGACFASAIVIYLTSPTDRTMALTLSPIPMASGAGALLQGTY